MGVAGLLKETFHPGFMCNQLIHYGRVREAEWGCRPEWDMYGRIAGSGDGLLPAKGGHDRRGRPEVRAFAEKVAARTWF
jgi:hypothetical protein